MTTPDLPMPYAVMWYLNTRYWYYVGNAYRQPGVSGTHHRHHLPEGPYQIVCSTIVGRGASIEVNGNDDSSFYIYELVPPGVNGTFRSGVATIHIPVGGGYLECKPIDVYGGEKPEDGPNTPLVMQVFPLESYES